MFMDRCSSWLTYCNTRSGRTNIGVSDGGEFHAFAPHVYFARRRRIAICHTHGLEYSSTDTNNIAILLLQYIAIAGAACHYNTMEYANWNTGVSTLYTVHVYALEYTCTYRYTCTRAHSVPYRTRVPVPVLVACHNIAIVQYIAIIATGTGTSTR